MKNFIRPQKYILFKNMKPISILNLEFFHNRLDMIMLTLGFAAFQSHNKGKLINCNCKVPSCKMVMAFMLII